MQRRRRQNTTLTRLSHILLDEANLLLSIYARITHTDANVQHASSCVMRFLIWRTPPLQQGIKNNVLRLRLDFLVHLQLCSACLAKSVVTPRKKKLYCADTVNWSFWLIFYLRWSKETCCWSKNLYFWSRRIKADTWRWVIADSIFKPKQMRQYF